MTPHLQADDKRRVTPIFVPVAAQGHRRTWLRRRSKSSLAAALLLVLVLGAAVTYGLLNEASHEAVASQGAR